MVEYKVFSITMLPLVFCWRERDVRAKLFFPSRGLAGQTKPRQKKMSTCSYLLFRASRASTLEHARTAAAPTAQSNSDNDADVRLHRIRHRVIAVVTHKLVCYCNTRYIYRLCLCIYDVLLLLILYMLSN